jgi:3',5'-cyclic-nucleotide phosphodiesterase
VSGPDSGLTQSFRQTLVSLGRDARNDFVLSDGFVSNRHGELVFRNGHLCYRDLKSRHGSLVMVDSVSTHLHEQENRQVELGNGAELQIGCSVLKLSMPERADTRPGQENSEVEESIAVSDSKSSRHREQLITAAHEPVSALTRRIDGNDRRLEILFQLAGQLNALSTLDEVLERIVEATFEAFPAANFFAITLVDDPDNPELEQPYLTRVRGHLENSDEQPVLSRSILERVLTEGQAVLWVKDSLGLEVSQSILDAKITACLAAPLVGQRSLLGLMLVDTRGRGSLFSKQDLDLFSVFASNAAFALERARLSDSIVQMFESFVEASVTAIEARDPTTAGHSQRVATYTLELAQVVNGLGHGRLEEIHLTNNEMTELRYAALLHDFGKIAVREDVLMKATRLPESRMRLVEQRFETLKALAYRELLEEAAAEGVPPEKLISTVEQRFARRVAELDKTAKWLRHVSSAPFLENETIALVEKLGKRRFVDLDGRERPVLTVEEVENLTIQRGTLNEVEWDNMRSHAARSEDYLERIPWSDELKNIPCIAGAHHEKLDGSGYPLGLEGDEIIPQVRMMTIADIFDALTAADRPYRKAATIERAVEILHLEADDNKLDKQLVEVFEGEVVPRIRNVVPSNQERSDDVV